MKDRSYRFMAFLRLPESWQLDTYLADYETRGGIAKVEFFG